MQCSIYNSCHDDCVHVDFIAKKHFALENCGKVVRTEKSEKTKSTSIMIYGKYTK